MAAGLVGTSGFAAIPTTALDPPHRAASPTVPALSGTGPHCSEPDRPAAPRLRDSRLAIHQLAELSEHLRLVLLEPALDPRIRGR